MNPPLKDFFRFLDQPVFGVGRVILVLLVIPLCLSYTQPLWTMHMVAPQYPDGLELRIFQVKLCLHLCDVTAP